MLSGLAFAIIAMPLAAQEVESRSCQPLSPTSEVLMTTTRGDKVRGTLLCLDATDVLLASDGGVTRHPLSQVRRIEKPRDGVNDGFLKGAAVGLVVWGLLCRGCDPSFAMRQTLGYATIGLAIDALQGNNTMIYGNRAMPSATVGWRVRF